MKLTLLSLALMSGALAAPAPAPVADPEAFSITEAPRGVSLEAHAISKRQYSSSSYNQLTDGTACRPISVIYARGTSQAGNVGDSASVGPLFFNQIASRVGGTSQLAIQGVTYPASVSGFLAGGDAAGSTTMTNLISSVGPTQTRKPAWKLTPLSPDRHPLPQHQDRPRRLQPGRATRAQRRGPHLDRQRRQGRSRYVFQYPNLTNTVRANTISQSLSSATQSAASPSAPSPPPRSSPSATTATTSARAEAALLLPILLISRMSPPRALSLLARSRHTKRTKHVLRFWVLG
jgi:hypothetical protein